MESVIRNAASQIAQVGIWKSLEGNVFSSQKLAAVRSVFELATKPVSPVTLINSPLPLALEIAIQIYPLFFGPNALLALMLKELPSMTLASSVIADLTGSTTSFYAFMGCSILSRFSICMFAPNNEKKMGKEKKTTLWAIFPLIEVVANIGAGTALFLSGRLNVFGVYSLTTNTIPFVSNIIHKLSSLE